MLVAGKLKYNVQGQARRCSCSLQQRQLWIEYIAFTVLFTLSRKRTAHPQIVYIFFIYRLTPLWSPSPKMTRTPISQSIFAGG